MRDWDSHTLFMRASDVEHCHTGAAVPDGVGPVALPAGWDIVVSSTGEEYYMNMDTGQRSYELPMADVEDGGALTPFLM